MAGGYKHGRYSWVGGTIGSTAAEKCATVLKGCAQVLLDLNVGWSLDTSLNATLDDYTSATGDIVAGTAQPCYLLFFTSTSGAKLCLGYRFRPSSYTTTSSSYDHAALSTSDCAGRGYPFGLIASIIPSGSSDTFSTTSPYRPSSSVPFIGTAMGALQQYYSVGMGSMAFRNSQYATFNYDIISNGLNIIVLNSSTDYNASYDYTGKYGGFVIGRLVTSFINDGDTSGYGCFSLALSGRYQYSSSYDYMESFISTDDGATGINRDSSWFARSGVGTTQNDYITQYYLYQYNTCQKADGSWLTGVWSDAGSTSSYNIFGVNLSSDFNQLYSTISAPNRWVPIMMYGYASAGTLSKYGVTSDTCLKGWIDPDLARIVNNNSTYQRGQTFDNGNLVYIGAGLAIGWDASNTTSIF